MPTELFVSTHYAKPSICGMQDLFKASKDYRVVTLRDFELTPLCTLDEFRSAYATLSVLLAALALHNTALKGAPLSWMLTVHGAVIERCSKDELLAWAKPDDSANAVVLANELAWGYWDGRLSGLRQHDMVYSALKSLGSFAFNTQDAPVVRAADKVAAATHKRFSEAVFLYASHYGSKPANTALIEKILTGVADSQAILALHA